MAASALGFLNSIEPHMQGCIILDVRLPDQNGPDQVRPGGARRAASHCLSDGVRGYTDSACAPSSRRRGLLRTKPVDGEVLLAAVSRALAQDADARAARAHRQNLRSRFERAYDPREREVFRI